MPEPSKALEAAARVMASAAWDEGMAYKAHVDPAERAQWVDKHWRDMLVPLRAAFAAVLQEPSEDLLAIVDCDDGWPPETTADVLRAVARYLLGEDVP